MNKDVRLWEELSKEEKDKIAMMRFRHSEEEQLKSLQSLLKTPPKIIEGLKESQARFNKKWQSKEFQVQIIKDEVTYTPKLLANDLRTFMWVIWYKYKKIRKINQIVVAELLLKLFPSSFMQDGELTKVESIKQHLGDKVTTNKIKKPDYIIEELKYK